MLTNRARKYLATLKRVSFVPTKQVENLLSDCGCPCISKWLDFHEEYAGYVEVLGKDKAIWGLAHEKPTWQDPFSVDVDYDKKESSYDIVCADVHPSYNYILSDNGEFWGFPSGDFNIYLERKALGHEFSINSNVILVTQDELDQVMLHEVLKNENLLSEASDRFYKYYAFKDLLLFEDLSDFKVKGWRRT